MWRRMHKNTDPKTYQTVDGHLRIITSLTATRCRGINDLRGRLEQYDIAIHKYLEAGGEAMSEVSKRHHLINITPEELFKLWQVQPGFMTWSSETIKNRMVEMINANYMFGIENNTRHGLYDLGCQPCGGGDSQWGMHGSNCGVNCEHDHHQPEENGSLSVLMGYDIDDPTLWINLIDHVRQGYWGITEEGDVANEATIQALVNKRTGKGNGKGKSKAGKKVCFKCGKSNHMAADCWSSAPKGKGKGKSKGKGKG